jgi:5-formyltetrahydrofolate cyclo-ligase
MLQYCMSMISSIEKSLTKVELRAAALARRNALTPEHRLTAAEAIAARAFPVDLLPVSIVAGYSPIRSEIDPLPLLQALARRGARLALPVVVARDRPLIFRSWSADTTLVRGYFGILEPPPDAAVLEPDVVLVPLAAFDRAGHRIGYGAGHYDRTFAQLRRSKSFVAVGMAFSVQEIPQVPALQHDAPLDYIATEHETIETGA